MNLSFIFKYKKYDVNNKHIYKKRFGDDILYFSYSDIKNEFISSVFLSFLRIISSLFEKKNFINNINNN